MINCPTCEFADFEKDKCTRLLNSLPHVCPYAEERKPRNHFERLKAMNMEQMAWELCRICRMPFYKDDSEIDTYEVDCWAKWLKEACGGEET